MEIILIRHAESEANLRKVYCGWSECRLTAKGKKQAEMLADRLSCTGSKKIFSSPSKRALETAAAIADKLCLEVEEEDLLKEINFGIFEDMSFNEISKRYPKETLRWTENFINEAPPKGESLIDLQKRVKKFVNKISSLNEDIICVSHGGTIKVIITELLGLGLERFWSFYIAPASVVRIEYSEGYAVLKELNQ